MAGAKGIKKPSLKEIILKMEKQTQTINELNADLHMMAEALEAEQNKVRVPMNLTVTQYNSLIDFLIENKPEPAFPKEVPSKVEAPAPPETVKDNESMSHVE